MSVQRRTVSRRFPDGTRTRRAKLHDQHLRQQRRAVGRGVVPPVADQHDRGEA